MRVKSMALTVVLLALAALAAFAQGAEEEKGSWAVTGWARANSGWDFEGESKEPKNLPQAPDADATGAKTTVTYTKGVWKVAGTAEVTTAKFGFSTATPNDAYGANGDITTTYASNGWTVAFKVAQNFVDTTRTAQFSAAKWDQAADSWGLKGTANFNLTPTPFLPGLGFDTESADNLLGVFLKFWDSKIILESGYGNYATDNDRWGSPGPLGTNLEAEDGRDSLLRVQVKPIEGLNFGFAYLPGYSRLSLGPGYNFKATSTAADPDTASFKPGDTIRATTFGAKYASGPLTLAAGANFKLDTERVYAGFAYKLLDDTITLSFDGDGQNLGVFENAGIFNLGERIKYASGPLEAQLTLKENNLVHNSAGGVAVKDLQLVVEPYVQYNIIEKVAQAKLAFILTKGLGDANKDYTEWKLTALFGWSLNEKLSTDPDSIGHGFVIGYQYGVKDTGVGDPGITNKLYFGVKATFE